MVGLYLLGNRLTGSNFHFSAVYFVRDDDNGYKCEKYNINAKNNINVKKLYKCEKKRNCLRWTYPGKNLF